MPSRSVLNKYLHALHMYNGEVCCMLTRHQSAHGSACRTWTAWSFLLGKQQ